MRLALPNTSISKVRSRNMAAIKGKDTKPELLVRRGLHARGFRFRLHSRSLPGKPDLVLHKHSTVIFVNGCFWHGHNCHQFRWPKTREHFWANKITGNILRDKKNEQELLNTGWRIAVVWECALRGTHKRESNLMLSDLSNFIVGQSAYYWAAGTGESKSPEDPRLRSSPSCDLNAT